MLVQKESARQYAISINSDPPLLGCRPSVDAFFISASKVFGGAIIAIILTGMGSDGTKGLEVLKKAGAYVIAQDEESSVVWGMPGSAVAAGVVDDVLHIQKISDAVKSIVGQSNYTISS